MRTIELFAGTGSFSKVAKDRGHSIFASDVSQVDDAFPIHLVKDIRQVTLADFPMSAFPVDILWASPPCEGFSVAAIGKNWTPPPENAPKTDSARLGLELVEHTWRLIDELKPTWWFIENPRGKLRKLPMMERAPFRHTVTYCQYGDTRMKPTDIWTNAPWWTPRAICKNGAPCHVSAPRGSSTGTQGLKTYKDRSRIPAGLFEELFDQAP